MVLLEILFVRHGLSCANAWGRKGGKTYQSVYSDPELTTQGIQRSVETGPLLTEQIAKYFPDGRYSLGASCMIRAQQTAYYMLGRATGRPIHILPHIGEFNDKRFPPGYCNFPVSLAEQREILGPEIAAQLGADARGDVSEAALSDWPRFLMWASTAGEPFFTTTTNAAGETVKRAVIVSHSLLFRRIFDHMVNNNDIIFARIRTDAFGADHHIITNERLTDIPLPKEIEGDVAGCRFGEEQLGPIVARFPSGIMGGLSGAVSGLWSRLRGHGRKRSIRRIRSSRLRKRTRRQRR
jgi:broad specificity phosphatase PhoE